MMGRFVIDGSFCVRRELAAEGNRDVDIQWCFGRAVEIDAIALVVWPTGHGIARCLEPGIKDVAECLADGTEGTGEDGILLRRDDFFDQTCGDLCRGIDFESAPVIKLHGDRVHVLLDTVADIGSDGGDGIEIRLEGIPQCGDFRRHGGRAQVHSNDAKCGYSNE